MSELVESQRLVQWLKESWLFSELEDSWCEELVSRSRQRAYPEGSTLMAQGSESEEALLMLSGSATISRAGPQGPPLTIRLAKPGDVLGEMGLICRQRRSATVMAHEDSRVLVIEQATFHDLLEAQPAFTRRVMEILCRRIVEGNTAWEMANSYGTDARLASLLLDLYDRFPVLNDGRQLIGVRLTHADLAAMVGMARENVTKGLARFRRAGAIAASRGQIEILDSDELRSWIC